MLELIEPKRDLNEWRRPMNATDRKPTLTFDLVPTRISCNSASFSIYRARVPGGWLVASRPNDSITFVPDPEHLWDGGAVS
jgi:hypothetical protein